MCELFAMSSHQESSVTYSLEEFADQQAVLFASVPLDEAGWQPLAEGTVIAVKQGEIVQQDTITSY